METLSLKRSQDLGKLETFGMGTYSLAYADGSENGAVAGDHKILIQLKDWVAQLLPSFRSSGTSSGR